MDIFVCPKWTNAGYLKMNGTNKMHKHHVHLSELLYRLAIRECKHLKTAAIEEKSDILFRYKYLKDATILRFRHLAPLMEDVLKNDRPRVHFHPRSIKNRPCPITVARLK